MGCPVEVSSRQLVWHSGGNPGQGRGGAEAVGGDGLIPGVYVREEERTMDKTMGTANIKAQAATQSREGTGGNERTTRTKQCPQKPGAQRFQKQGRPSGSSAARETRG